MTSNQIRYFISAVKYMNFSQAAEDQFVSQPALSRAISSLEDELGVKLFERKNNVLTLTEGGDMIYTWFIAQVPHLDAVIKRARKLSADSDKMLSVGIIRNDTLPERYARGLARYVSENPGVDLSIHHFEMAQEAVRETVDGSNDLVIVMESAIEDCPGLISFPVCTYRRNVAVSLNHPLSGKKIATLNDFKDDNFIVINSENSPSMNHGIKRICEGVGFSPKILEGKNIQRVMEMVEEGKGVALLYVGHAERYNNLLKFINIRDNITVNQVIAYRRDNKNPNIQKFLDTLFEE